MRLTYLTHQYFPRHVGGTEVYTRGLACRARAAGHEVRIVTYHESPSGAAADHGIVDAEHDGITVREIHYNLSTAPDPARYEHDNAFVAGAVAEELAGARPDVVHVMHAMKLSGAALQACLDARVPYVATLCDFWFICPRHTLLRSDGRLCDGPAHRLDCVRCLHDTHGFVPRALAMLSDADLAECARDAVRARRRSRAPGVDPALWDLHAIRRRNRYLRRRLLGARRIIALSAFQKRVFADNGLPAERIEVIEHGLETADLMAPPRRPAAHPRIGFVGSLVPHKGPHVLLEALSRIPSCPVECRIWGAVPGTPYGDRLREAAARDARISLAEGFPPDALGRVLADMDVLAVPSLWYENDPLVVKAAFHAGLPVLASRIGSLAEMIAPGVNGWLVEPGAAAAWAEAIERLAATDRLRSVAPTPVKTMDENAREMLTIYAEEACR